MESRFLDLSPGGGFIGIIIGGFKQVGEISLRVRGYIRADLRPEESGEVDTFLYDRRLDFRGPSPELLDFLRRDAVELPQRRPVLERPEDTFHGVPGSGPSALGKGGGVTGQGQHGRPRGHGRQDGVGPQVHAVRQTPLDRVELVLGSLAEVEFHARAFDQEVVGEPQLMAKE